jgi:hypothetical protein
MLGWCNMIHDAHAMTINGDYIKITKCSYVPTISNTLEKNTYKGCGANCCAHYVGDDISCYFPCSHCKYRHDQVISKTIDFQLLLQKWGL